MLSIIPARPGDEHALSELRRRVWLTTYRGIYPGDEPWQASLHIIFPL